MYHLTERLDEVGSIVKLSRQGETVAAKVTLKGLSRMRGNPQVRFFGGKRPVMALPTRQRNGPPRGNQTGSPHKRRAATTTGGGHGGTSRHHPKSNLAGEGDAVRSTAGDNPCPTGDCRRRVPLSVICGAPFLVGVALLVNWR